MLPKKETKDVISLLRSVEDNATRAEINAERSLVLELEGGCRVPIGAVGHVVDNNLSLFGCIFSLNERKKISASAQGTLADAYKLGEIVGQDLIKHGAKDLEKEWRQKYGTW